ncbi:hypothetical protein [Novosphingobium sp. TCA1]|uniref:hypothetical protein n=1 Tax=Novosphingobium sp. TCA1 TaxID=2682474 RepID=UPI00135BE144|nr:hypothetical protein [Novosphingobium sp. TCA1]
MFYITRKDDRPDGYVVLSESRDWERWLARNIPTQLNAHVRRCLISNLKHLMVGLEVKTALINAHHFRGPGDASVLFEPYFQNLILEFCVSAFSILEGIGAAHCLHQTGRDGAGAPRIDRNDWMPSLRAIYDATGELGLQEAVARTLMVRDKLHQDRLGARADIDWHSLSYDAAFSPASAAIRILLRQEAGLVPGTSNLHVELD